MKYLRKNIKFFIVFIITTSLSLIFIEPISNLLLKIGGYFDYESPSFKTGYFIILILLIIAYIYFIWKDFIHNKQITFIIFYTTTIYFLLRFVFSDYLEFIWLDKLFVYADWILIIALLHCTNLVKVGAKVSKRQDLVKLRKINFKLTGRNENFFVQDTLFDEGEIDNEQILQKLIETVRGFKPQIAFSIGLNAVWGYGKSSFLKRFEEHYRREPSRGIVFWYHVWKNKGANAIIENFFQELKISLAPHSATLSSDIDNYVDSILSLTTSELHRLLSTGKDALSENKSLEMYYNNINDCIRNIDRQIIVLLDDLDRLEQEEILNTLKLIRAISDFNNLIFIAGYDREYIVNSLGKDKDNYLDKIFNVELHLLPFNEKRITDELVNFIEGIFPLNTDDTDNPGFNNSFKKLFRKDQYLSIKQEINLNNLLSRNTFICTDHTLSYSDFLSTYRDVKRFVNEFKFGVTFLAEEKDVVAEEYILLKLLTYKYRELQNLIFNKLDNLLDKGIIDKVNEKIVLQNGYNELYIYNSTVKERVKSILGEYKPVDWKIINSVLCRLFGEKELSYYDTNQNCISKIYHTNIYVRNNLVGGSITQSQLHKAFENYQLFELAKDVAKTTQQSSGQLRSELRTFIFQNPPQNKLQFLDFLNTVNVIMNLNIHEDNEKVLKIMSAYNEVYETKDAFILDLITIIKNNPLDYLINLITDLNINAKRKDKAQDYQSGILIYKEDFFTIKEIELMMNEKLKYDIDNKKNISEIIQLYNQMVKRIVADKKILKPKEANELIREDISARFTNYYNSRLFDTINGNADRRDLIFDGIVPYAFFPQIFADPNTYNELLEGVVTEAEFDKYLEEGWQNFRSFLETISKMEDIKINIGQRFENTKSTLDTFINNKYKGLNEAQYELIWGATSNKGFMRMS